jgi:hypothetical protein
LNEAAETSEVEDALPARREFYKEPDMAWIAQPRPRKYPRFIPYQITSFSPSRSARKRIAIITNVRRVLIQMGPLAIFTE